MSDGFTCWLQLLPLDQLRERSSSQCHCRACFGAGALVSVTGTNKSAARLSDFNARPAPAPQDDHLDSHTAPELCEHRLSHGLLYIGP